MCSFQEVIPFIITNNFYFLTNYVISQKDLLKYFFYIIFISFFKSLGSVLLFLQFDVRAVSENGRVCPNRFRVTTFSFIRVKALTLFSAASFGGRRTFLDIISVMSLYRWVEVFCNTSKVMGRCIVKYHLY